MLLDDRYQVSTVLGGGGSSVVYLAYHHVLRREVALKVVRPEVFESESDVELYLDEARIVASLDHPNIVTIHDVGRLPDQRPYIVMEHVPGRSLSRLLEGDGALPLDMAMDLFEQVAEALGHAHRHGVVHRDVKPANILVRQRSTGRLVAKLADFGIASVAVAGDRPHPADFVGTPHYMSPEQAAGEPVVPASDLYSLGLVLYRALTGVRPFEAEAPHELARMHLEVAPRPFQAVAPDSGIPPELERVVMKCLAKAPADRYPSADALLADLYDLRRRLTVELRLTPVSAESRESFAPGRSAGSSVGGLLTFPPVEPVEQAPLRTALVAALAVVVAFGGGLVFGVWMQP